MALACKICKDAIVDRQYLKCLHCDQSFHLDCASVSTQRYILMSPGRKGNWKCHDCWDLIRAEKNYKSKSPCDYVTHERPKYKANVSVENSFQSLSSTISDDDEESPINGNTINSSFTDLTTGKIIEELQNTISVLKTKLKSAENKIEILKGENLKQKQKINEYENRIKTNTSTCESDTRKKKRRTSLNKTRLDMTKEESSSELTLNEIIQETPKKHGKSTQNGFELKNSQENTTITENEAVLYQLENEYQPSNNEKIEQTQNKNLPTRIHHRICIFGDEQSRGLCRQLSKSVGDKYTLYSELKPEATTDKVLENIMSQCCDYGKADYIIIVSGKNDQDITRMSSYLYYYLSQLKNTNIILCEPSENKYINAEQLSELYTTLATHLLQVKYIDLRYSYLGIPRNKLKHLTQNILQEILRSEYTYKLNSHRSQQIYNMMRKHNKKQETNINSSETAINKTSASLDKMEDITNNDIVFFRQ